MMKKYLVILLLSAISTSLLAQEHEGNTQKKVIDEEPPVDGYFVKSDIEDRKAVRYSVVRSSDAVFSKRVWREMDLRDSINLVFASPKARLMDVLLDAIKEGELTAYDPTPTKADPTGDRFMKRYTSAQAIGRLVDSVLVPQFDDEGYQTGSAMMPGEFNTDSVTRFRIKEDWFFDRQRSVFEPRIIGLAPLMKINMGGVSLDEQPAFWIYFPEARHILVNKEVVDPVNDALGISFDDLFTRRMFTSTVIKESNPQELRIKDYMQGDEIAKEAQKIEDKMVAYDNSLWIKEAPKPEKKKEKKKKKKPTKRKKI